jgi:hypothetical protein
VTPEIGGTRVVITSVQIPAVPGALDELLGTGWTDATASFSRPIGVPLLDGELPSEWSR